MAVEWDPFSRNALRAINQTNSFINILEGAVRSSKTVAANIRWINFLKESPHSEFLMTGVTSDTLYRNVIAADHGIIDIIGQNNCDYKSSSKGGAQLRLNLNGQEKVCYCVGVPNTKAESKIRGMTIGGWYADETTLYPEKVVKTAINRMSLPGAKAIWTMNPDNPYHYIKKEYIDLAQEKNYSHIHFTLDDNLSLTEEYKNNIKNAYSGVWYQRMIQGLWVLAEGLVYDMFSEKQNVVSTMPGGYKREWIGIDYGTANDTVFVLIRLSNNNKLYIADEWRWGRKSKGYSKTDVQLRKELQKFIKRNNAKPKRIFIDPSAASFIEELYQHRFQFKAFKNLVRADNSKKKGIQRVSSLLGINALLVLEHCEGVIEEFMTYSWDPKAQQRGEDEPLKEYDHSMDAIRYVINGIVRLVKKILKSAA